MIRSKDGAYGFFDVCAAPGFGLKEEFFGGRSAEDYAGGGVETHIGLRIVFDVLGSCIHPGAEEDGCWVVRGADVGIWRCVEADLWGEAGEC